MDTFYKTLPKRHKTKNTGIYYKEIEKTIIDEKGNSKTSICDKVYSIQFKDTDDKWKFKTIGKYSEGIREAYCKEKRIEILNATNLGEQPELIRKTHKKNYVYFKDIAEEYFNSLKLNHEDEDSRSIKDMKSKFNNHLALFHDRDILSIEKDELVELQKKLAKDYAPKTNNMIIDLFSSIYNYGLNEKIYDRANIASNVKRLDINNARDRFLTKPEIDDLFEEIKENFILNLFVHLALSTGARLEGILSIKKKDIVFINNGGKSLDYININDFKNNSTYAGYMTDKLKETLAEHIKNLKANDFVVSLDGTKMTDRQIQSRLKPILDRLFNDDLDASDSKNRVVIHSLRHTFASHLAINGTPIFTIQRLMNHQKIEMTMRYAKLAPDNGIIAVKSLYQ